MSKRVRLSAIILTRAKLVLMVASLSFIGGCSSLVCDARTDEYTNELDKTLGQQECEQQVRSNLRQHRKEQAAAKKEETDQLLKASIENATSKS
ncbi:hypothetical protein [Shewanella sp. TC10]|uniref:hypothetical protein n=1 Tax=Shewanella sp. TC10 TaxID=1419739 RepID=UPI00129E9AAA|nr:hypothetical protein [Shewanella sp. TC10]